MSEINDTEYVFDYWSKLPNIRMLTVDQFKKSKGDIRQAIIRVLSFGLEREVGSQKQKRHVLSGKEILELVRKRTNVRVSKSNLYYHIRELEKLELVKMINVAVSNHGRGKKFSAYYGRTAKLFRFEPEVDREKEEIQLLYKDNFIDLIRGMNPDLSDDMIMETIDKIKKINRVNNDFFFEWLEKNEKMLDNFNIDLNEFGRMIIFLQLYDPKVMDGIISLRPLLGM